MTPNSPLSRLTARANSLCLLLYLLLLVSLAQAMVALLPFRFYAKWLQRRQTGKDAPAPLVRSLRRKLRIAANILPWKPQCFPLALAGRYVLTQRGYASDFSLGVSDPVDMQRAHAWLKSGGLFVSGREEHQHYREVARF